MEVAMDGGIVKVAGHRRHRLPVTNGGSYGLHQSGGRRHRAHRGAHGEVRRGLDVEDIGGGARQVARGDHQLHPARLV